MKNFTYLTINARVASWACAWIYSTIVRYLTSSSIQTWTRRACVYILMSKLNQIKLKCITNFLWFIHIYSIYIIHRSSNEIVEAVDIRTNYGRVSLSSFLSNFSCQKPFWMTSRILNGKDYRDFYLFFWKYRNPNYRELKKRTKLY